MVGKIKDLKKIEVTSDLAKGASMQVLVSPEQGWDDYVMRMVYVEKEGFTPEHMHPWPHINYVVSGEGELVIDGKANKVKSGSYAFVPENRIHQFRNVGTTPFQFICIVPKEGHII